MQSPSRPNKTWAIAVDDRHTLHVEEWGNPHGQAAVFLHGGPGAGCEPWHRNFFDPARYRIILFDQRGCGRSRPHADLTDNTTWHLVSDIETIRTRLSIDRWLVFGGSWGSTLALAYAETHPERVSALVLRGIFLCRDSEIQWFYQHGANQVFPDYWQDFIAPIAPDDRHDMINAYYRLLTGDDEIAMLKAARAWSVWEGRTATLQSNPDVIRHFSDPHVALSIARIECHYFVNHAFLDDNQLLHQAGRIADIPGIIVQGRYDMICPMVSAWELHNAWPNSELQIIDTAGHSAAEIPTTKALLDATGRFG